MCMLNCKTEFVIPNIPENTVLLRFNITFAFVYDAVSGGKGVMQLKVEPAKTQTISCVMREIFPAIKYLNNEKLHLLNPRIMGKITFFPKFGFSNKFKKWVHIFKNCKKWVHFFNFFQKTPFFEKMCHSRLRDTRD